MNDSAPSPLFDAVDDAWLEIGGAGQIKRLLTRAAQGLFGTQDAVGQSLRRLLAPLVSGDDLALIMAAAGEELAVPRRLPALQVITASNSRLCDVHLRAGEAGRVLIGFRDVTDAVHQRLALEQAHANARLAHAVLAGDPRRLHDYLRTAAVTIALIKSLLQLPARDPGAFRQKLERIHTEVFALRGGAESLGLAAIAVSARGCELAVAAIRLDAQPNGDEFLPLAARLNDLFTHLNAATALIEQRTATKAPVTAERAWQQRCEGRLRETVDRLAGDEAHRAKLVLLGLDSVPESLHESVDGMLDHLIGNACEHGIEPTEQRLAAGKQAHGTITVQIARADGTLEMTVQDDGQGFDTEKLGRAAVARGLLAADALPDTPARALIGLIFRPGFSTAPVSAPGRGLGMEFLRELVARLDGHINVATKARQYTRFSISLPLKTTHARARRSHAA